MARAHQIAARILDRAHQIAEGLILDAGHEREAKLPRGQQPCQADRVTAVGLHAITRPFGIDPGAATRTSIPRPRAARARPKPVGPAS